MATTQSADQQSDLSPLRYKAFISYSHRADAVLAPALKAAIERFAKPWYRRRALRIFLDETNLALTPKLWSSIQLALGQAEYLILLGSPESASSEWVKMEVECWLSSHSVERILIVRTGGEILWDRIHSDFDWSKTTALPKILSGHFPEEPQYLDFHWVRENSKLSLTDGQFYDGVVSISAVLRGKSKDELSGEDLRQHKRTIRDIAAVAIAMFVLLILSAIATHIAMSQTALAERRLRAATARELADVVLNTISDDQLSLLLALRSADTTRTVDGFVLEQSEEALESAVMRAGGERKLDLPWVATNGFLTISQNKIAVSQGSVVNVYDVPVPYRNELKTTMVLSGRKKDINVVSFSPDRRYLAAAAEGGVQVWNVADGKVRLGLSPEGPGIQTVTFSPNGRQLLTGGRDGTAVLWDAETGRPILTFPGHTKTVRTLAFNITGSQIATGSADKMAIIWDSVSGNLVRKFGPQADVVNRVAFSPDGRYLATASGFEVNVWDALSGRRLQTLAGQLGTITAVQFLPPYGKKVITGSLDGSIRIWDTATGQLLLDIKMGPEDRVYGLAVTPDGDHVATLGTRPEGISIRVFPLALDHLMSVARSLVTRTLTEEECRKYLHTEHGDSK